MRDASPTISPDLHKALGRHNVWLQSDGCDGERAELETADFSGQNLEGTDFTRSGLPLADFKYARLDGAKFCEFARADLTRTRLPPPIAEFTALQSVEEISQNARKMFFAILLGCTYCWLTIATTSDIGLLTNSYTSRLPVIGTEILIAFFYWVAPVVMMMVFYYLHLYLQRLWEALASLPARFPDGKRLDEHAYPWLLNGLVRHHFDQLKKNRPIYSKLEARITILLAWWVVPFTLLGFWWRYLWRHDWIGTCFHIFLLSGCTWAAMAQLRHSGSVLSGPSATAPKVTRPERLIVGGLALVTILVSVFAIGNPLRLERNNGYFFFADFKDETLSTRPSDWTGIPEKAEVETAKVRGARLSKANLNWADFENAFLVKGYLEKSNLDYTQIKNVDFRRANLKKASLRWANADFARFDDIRARRAKFHNSDLEFCRFRNAYLHEAEFEAAYLNGADLHNAVLTKANLRGAQIGCGIAEPDMIRQCATLTEVNLKEANLAGACFQKADLRGAKGLTPDQLCQAGLDPEIEAAIETQCPQLLKKPAKSDCTGGEQRIQSFADFFRRSK